MKITDYSYKHSFTVDTDFTADMAPAYISNPETNKHIPHRRL